MANVVVGNITIEKAEDLDNGQIKIRMIAHSMENDREDDILTEEAFNKSAKGFIKRGVLDWLHKSRSKGSTEQERYGAIIGTPTEFKWEIHNGKKVPVFYGIISRNHDLVKSFILPHLMSNVPVLEASIGGSVLEAEESIDKASGKKIRRIIDMDLDHIAIAPRNRVMSPGSLVTMVKAQTDAGFAGQCECGGLVYYESFCDLNNDIRDYNNCKESLMSKAMEAGIETDSSNMQGFNATQKQSLEGKQYRGLSRLIGLMIRRGDLPNNRNSISGFVEKEVGKDKAVLFMKRFDNALKDAKGKK